ncbi:hypothetical protein K435DRAFT_804731 [Dendrothele bispora CBS 962.96]|uniref:Uncharacterized protein n=1 Tax=Dendrothele bispora (strain CBS 962.96) TaxID=1314807 RepID=A0A4S8LDW3_DENBC|nr:hypothetical protein K435DRAFT_804731 [Dendrothele bispora CBS 962.96]
MYYKQYFPGTILVEKLSKKVTVPKGTTVRESDTVRSLGVFFAGLIFDSKLSWKTFFDRFIQANSTMLGSIYLTSSSHLTFPRRRVQTSHQGGIPAQGGLRISIFRESLNELTSEIMRQPSFTHEYELRKRVQLVLSALEDIRSSMTSLNRSVETCVAKEIKNRNSLGLDRYLNRKNTTLKSLGLLESSQRRESPSTKHPANNRWKTKTHSRKEKDVKAVDATQGTIDRPDNQGAKGSFARFSILEPIKDFDGREKEEEQVAVGLEMGVREVTRRKFGAIGDYQTDACSFLPRFPHILAIFEWVRNCAKGNAGTTLWRRRQIEGNGMTVNGVYANDTSSYRLYYRQFKVVLTSNVLNSCNLLRDPFPGSVVVEALHRYGPSVVNVVHLSIYSGWHCSIGRPSFPHYTLRGFDETLAMVLTIELSSSVVDDQIFSEQHGFHGLPRVGGKGLAGMGLGTKILTLANPYP